MSTEDVLDVLVIGSGLAGLATAIAAREAGAQRVLVAESQNVIGGSTRLCDGIILGANSAMQRAHGIVDSAKAFFNEYMALTQYELAGGLIKVFAEQSGPAIDWLGSHGVEFHDVVFYGGSENTPRAVAAKERGQGIVNALAASARALGIDFALGLPARELLTKGGRIVGALLSGEQVFASTVVLASGGFGANAQLLAQWFPSVANCGDWAWYMGAGGAQGDALRMAESVGARISGFDRGLRLLHPNFVRTQEPYLPAWQVLVDAGGERFIDESTPYGALDRAMALRGDRGFVIFDQQALLIDPDTQEPPYKQTVTALGKRRSANWNRAMLEEMIDAGAIAQAPSLVGLAEVLGLPVDQLECTVAQYNEGAAAGSDAFGKEARFLRPLLHAPFYGREIRPATIAATGAGPAIDARAQVLDRLGTPIPGLYAAGEVTGGFLGTVYAGSGNSLAGCATFGRIAGASAAAAAAAS